MTERLDFAVPGLTAIDVAAFWYFLLAWIGYNAAADHSRWERHGVTAAMDRYRLAWMREMLGRDLRMVDTQIVGNLISGIGFFASATILLVGGLVAVLGAADQAIGTLAELPFAVSTSRSAWEVKVLLLIGVFVYAFFKFAWSYRLYNYCSILIGASPALGPGGTPSGALSAAAEAHAQRTVAIVNRASRHFNRGLRAYFFALAALAWFVHPWLMILAATWVVFVLYRREFRSLALAAIRGEP